MERRLDDLMRRRLRHDTVDLASVVDQARKLHHYRAERGYPAHLDERVAVDDQVGCDSYARVIGDHYDWQRGRW